MSEAETSAEIIDVLRDRFPEIEKRKREEIAAEIARRLAPALEKVHDDFDY